MVVVPTAGLAAASFVASVLAGVGLPVILAGADVSLGASAPALAISTMLAVDLVSCPVAQAKAQVSKEGDGSRMLNQYHAGPK